MISPDSCSQLVAGNYDVIVDDPTSPFKSALLDYLQRFELYESQIQNQEFGYIAQFRQLKEFSKQLKEDKANLTDGELFINQRKNRYKDIIPFGHTRVLLDEDPAEPGSGYINANYIRGPSGSLKSYIACQGPLACTLNDFWRMIWECNVSVIIMACNEHESGKPKCELYWPDQVGMSQCYDNIQVSLVKVRQICSDFCIRKFTVKLYERAPNPRHELNHNNHGNHVSSDHSSTDQFTSENTNDVNNDNNNNDEIVYNVDDLKARNRASDRNRKNGSEFQTTNGRILAERTICQFHYSTWPDHGVPDSVQPILELVRLVREVQPAEDKPLLVHCSAGCGRTGTICCIDYVSGLLKQGKLDTSFDLCSIIRDMRQQRMAMVQTLEQYILCHRAVAALFINQLNLIENHTYENLEGVEGENEEESIEQQKVDFDEQDLGPVFI